MGISPLWRRRGYGYFAAMAATGIWVFRHYGGDGDMGVSPLRRRRGLCPSTPPALAKPEKHTDARIVHTCALRRVTASLRSAGYGRNMYASLQVNLQASYTFLPANLSCLPRDARLGFAIIEKASLGKVGLDCLRASYAIFSLSCLPPSI